MSLRSNRRPYSRATFGFGRSTIAGLPRVLRWHAGCLAELLPVPLSRSISALLGLRITVALVLGWAQLVACPDPAAANPVVDRAVGPMPPAIHRANAGEGGAPLGYTLYGDASAKETIVLVNGSFFNAHQWDVALRQMYKAQAKGQFNFLVFDYPGLGQSASLPPVAKGIGLEVAADKIAALIRHVQGRHPEDVSGRVHLYGTSIGGILALSTAGKHPQLVRSVFSYATPSPDLTGKKPALSRHLQKEFSGRLERFDAYRAKHKTRGDQPVDHDNFDALIEEVFASHDYDKSPQHFSRKQKLRTRLMKAIVKPMMIHTRHDSMEHLLVDYSQDLAPTAREFSGLLRRIPRTTEIHLVYGSADKIATSEMAQQLADALPHAHVTTLTGLGHGDALVVPWKSKNVLKELRRSSVWREANQRARKRIGLRDRLGGSKSWLAQRKVVSRLRSARGPLQQKMKSAADKLRSRLHRKTRAR